MIDERMAPVQGYSAGIPWSLHLRAWDAYAAKYGRYQSAERIAERAGFSVGELDMFVPGWREEVSEITKLRAEVVRLTAVREPVRWFAEQMERKLALHDDRGGWSGCDADWLLQRLENEMDELVVALRGLVLPWQRPTHRQQIIDEAADVANFAMMIADNARAALAGEEVPE